MLGHQFKNLVFKWKAASDRDPGKFQLSSERDWRLLIAGFVLLNAISAVFSFNLFFSISSDESFILTAAELKKEPVTRGRLEEALLYLEEKEALFEALSSRRPSVPDPSK